MILKNCPSASITTKRSTKICWIAKRSSAFTAMSDTYLVPDDPFFERYYAGGIGSIRGFQFRGISPRDGPDNDRIGGDFLSHRHRRSQLSAGRRDFAGRGVHRFRRSGTNGHDRRHPLQHRHRHSIDACRFSDKCRSRSISRCRSPRIIWTTRNFSVSRWVSRQ